ncbi:hypothetical protein [Reinekea marinisedimentorum]|uniref:hypothetical protein n=1 Tax=Reinekea marinisedimentorum TaxID=230495 RepID=UPI001A9F01E1|nr:hypothetical protein [Reinekea marinisedimentorum]
MEVILINVVILLHCLEANSRFCTLAQAVSNSGFAEQKTTKALCMGAEADFPDTKR